LLCAGGDEELAQQLQTNKQRTSNAQATHKQPTIAATILSV
jgi:hypothetical protein